MARIVDLYCRCGRRENDVMAGVDETFECVDCHEPMEQDWLPRTRRSAQWDDSTAVMVLVNNDPNCPADVRVRYPGQHNCRVPAGYERVYLRSLADVNRFEKEHHVANHVMHFDQNGRSIDDQWRGRDMT